MAQDPRPHEYSDDDPNFGETIYSPAERWIGEALDRTSDTFRRLKREIRGTVHPLRYEALLRRLENIAIEIGSGGVEVAFSAERRLDEFDDDVAVVLASSQAPIAVPEVEEYAYREDQEGYGEYGEGTEEWISHTSKRLERLRVRLRRELRGKLSVQEYDALSARVVHATIEYRGGLRNVIASAERAVGELRAEIDARAAEVEES